MAGLNSLFECGVDYITLTATSSNRIQTLYDAGLDVVREEAGAGNKMLKWRSLGYTGLQAGSASVGEGKEGSIVRLSSGLAADHWWSLYPFSTNCSRIDLQFTVNSGRPVKHVLLKVWKDAIDESQKRKRALKLKQILSPGQPETVMIGSRQSERYGRAYDKGVESGLDHYAGCVRFEGEFKGSWAKRVCRALATKPRERHAVVPFVLDFFSKNGVSVQSALGGSALSYKALETLVCTYPSDSRGTVSKSKARSLRWLQVSCRPVVQRLIAAGLSKELYSALGLLDHTETD